jgi:hypothetical protein
MIVINGKARSRYVGIGPAANGAAATLPHQKLFVLLGGYTKEPVNGLVRPLSPTPW